MEIIVEPDGNVRECKVIAFVGSDRLAAQDCSDFSRRKLRPAIGLDGLPILGVYKTTLIRELSGQSPEIQAVRNWIFPADVTVPLEEVLDDSRTRVDVALAILVHADGSVAACEGIAERNERERVRPDFVNSACVEANKLRRTPLTAADGQPTAYVANIIVRFVTPSAT